MKLFICGKVGAHAVVRINTERAHVCFACFCQQPAKQATPRTGRWPCCGGDSVPSAGCPAALWGPRPPLSCPHPWSALAFCHIDNSAFSRMLCRWNQTLCDFGYWFFFPQHNSLETHLDYCMSAVSSFFFFFLLSGPQGVSELQRLILTCKERVCCLCLGLSWIKLLYTFVGRFFKKIFVYFWLCWVFVGVCSPVAVHMFLVAAASLVVERGLQAVQVSGAGRVRSVAVASGLSSCSSWAREHRLNSYLGSSWIRDWTRVSCIGRQILYHWATREVLWAGFCANESFHFSGLNAQECNFWVVCLIF